MVGFYGRLPGLMNGAGVDRQDGWGTPSFSPADAGLAPGAGTADFARGGKAGDLVSDPGPIVPQRQATVNIDPVRLPKPGPFDQGGFGRNFLTYLLAGKNAPAIAQMQMDERRRERDLEVARQDRLLDRADWLWRLRQQQFYRAPQGQPMTGNE